MAKMAIITGFVSLPKASYWIIIGILRGILESRDESLISCLNQDSPRAVVRSKPLSPGPGRKYVSSHVAADD